MEDKPDKLRIPTGDNEVAEYDKHSAHLFSYTGQCALGLSLGTYDHIYLVDHVDTKDEDGDPVTVSIGWYLWKADPEGCFEEIRAYMLDHKYPAHTDLQTIDPNDVIAFNHEHLFEVEDGIPADWS